MKTKLGLVAVALAFLFSLAACFDADGVWLVKTADPNLAFEVTLPKPNLLPTVTPTAEVVEEPTVDATQETGEVVQDPMPVPPCQQIKGNISRSGEKIYHVPGSANYDQVKINEAKGEKWFCSEEEAQAAGWRKAAH